MCPCDGRAPAEPAGQRGDYLPISRMNAAEGLPLNHCSTATGKPGTAQVPAGSGPRAVTWPNTAPPELATAEPRARAHALAASGDDLAAYCLSWGYMWWQVLGSNQRRLSRRFLQTAPKCFVTCANAEASRVLRLFTASPRTRPSLSDDHRSKEERVAARIVPNHSAKNARAPARGSSHNPPLPAPLPARTYDDRARY